MNKKIVWQIALKTVSEGNGVRVLGANGRMRSEHWKEASKRHNLQQFFIRKLFSTLETAVSLPCCVKMIRLGGSFLDEDDNLRMAFKWIKDEISVCLIPERRTYYMDKNGKAKEIKGRADDDKRIKWEYGQEKAKTLGIRIEITEGNA